MFSWTVPARLHCLSSKTLEAAKFTVISQRITIFSYKLSSKASGNQDKKNPQYVQIPEHLKIHMFTPELEIIRYDELRAPFKRFSSGFILKLLELRANEIRLEMVNSNPKSRICKDNVVRFMKVLARLRELFRINGGNTEVLDAVLQSQSALEAFEEKLAAKKKAAENTSDKAIDLYSGPYVQIPESLELHSFAKELEILRTHELKRDFGAVSAHELIKVLEERLKEVHTSDSSNADAGIGKHNLVQFYKLLPKLQKLLAWNGGATTVLDTLLNSEKVFTEIDAKIKAKRIEKESATYKQVPDDMILEEYSEELNEVKQSLKSTFAAASSVDVLKAVNELSDAHSGSEKGLNFSKLFRNLAMLFKHNNGQTFVLDNVLVNAAVFDKIESRLSSKPPTELKTEPEVENETKVDYRGTDHVIGLLNNSQGSGIREDLLQEERTIQSALAEAMSKEEKNLYEKDPKEYEELVSLTSEKIRGKYRQPQVKSSKSVKRNDIQNYLKKIKEKKEKSDETRWREQTAYEWSNAHYKGHRSFEARNFFDPIFASGKSTKFPMFPGTGEQIEYLILSSNGEKFYTPRNPLGLNHVPEDMFAILQTLSEEDLAKFSRNVEKLRRKGWRLIGSGRTKGMLVLSREVRKRSRVGKFIKFLLATSGLCFVTLISVNWLVDDRSMERIVHVIEKEKEKGKEKKEANETESTGNSGETVGEEPEPKRSLWQRLLWY